MLPNLHKVPVKVSFYHFMVIILYLKELIKWTANYILFELRRGCSNVKYNVELKVYWYIIIRIT